VRLAFFAFAVLLATAAVAQTAPPPKDERVVLDAQEKHIVRELYHDDEAILLQGNEAGGWRLSAGAAIDARRIDLRMRNIRGEVRFRADWSRLDALLRRQRRGT
jgi:hypothetical protein